MTIFKPPQNIPDEHPGVNVFLAGSIENGLARNWQKDVEKELSCYDINAFNPRRDDWNPNAGKEELDAQIKWELNALACSDVIAMCFDENTKSPITLLEFGIFVDREPYKLITFCPENFYRYQNVKTTADYYGQFVHTDYDLWLLEIKSRINKIL